MPVEALLASSDRACNVVCVTCSAEYKVSTPSGIMISRAVPIRRPTLSAEKYRNRDSESLNARGMLPARNEPISMDIDSKSSHTAGFNMASSDRLSIVMKEQNKSGVGVRVGSNQAREMSFI
jgi:hypothetical protein